MKLADAVTCDDQGDVIPLSERFDKGNEDIRYSLRDVDGKNVVWISENILSSKPKGQNISDFIVDYLAIQIAANRR